MHKIVALSVADQLDLNQANLAKGDFTNEALMNCASLNEILAQISAWFYARTDDFNLAHMQIILLSMVQ